MPRRDSGGNAATFEFFGNHPALDFVNTVHGRLRTPVDRLATVDALLSWLAAAGQLDQAQATEWRQRCRVEPEIGMWLLREAHTLRDALWDALRAAAVGERPPAEAMAALNRVLAHATHAWQVASIADGGLAVQLVPTGEPLMRPITDLAEMGAELLCSPSIRRVRKCAQHDCGGLFYDVSKAGRRQWCRMETCGNRAKASRHYHRQTHR